MRWFRKRNETTEHEYVEERLSAYLDGELSQKEWAVVDRHLAACQSCQWNLATLKQTIQWTREMPAVPVPRVFTIPASAAPARRPRRNWGFVPLLQGATAIVALLLFFVMAGDFLWTGSMMPASAPDIQMLSLEAPAEGRAVAERKEFSAGEAPPVAEADMAEVEVEKEAVPPPAPQAEAPAEKVAAEPTRPLEPAVAPAEPVVVTEQVEEAAPAAAESTAGGAADTTEARETAVKTGIAGVRATPTLPLTATYFFTSTKPGARPTRSMSGAHTVPTAKVALATDAPQATPTLQSAASPTRVSMTIPTPSAVAMQPTATPVEPTPTLTTAPPLEPTATLLPAPTELPAVAPPPTTESLAAAPTVVGQAQKPERWGAAEESNELGTVRDAPVVNWLRAVELSLAIVFVLLVTITIVAMVRRRQAR